MNCPFPDVCKVLGCAHSCDPWDDVAWAGGPLASKVYPQMGGEEYAHITDEEQQIADDYRLACEMEDIKQCGNFRYPAVPCTNPTCYYCKGKLNE